MWTCSRCGERHDDQFDSCWKCTGEARPASVSVAVAPDPVSCPRCGLELEFVGNRKFHDGPRWGILGDLGELFVHRQSFDIFVCSRCGRVEFFLEGIGEEFRPIHQTSRGLPTEEEGFALLNDATALEWRGDVLGAMDIYRKVVAKFPGTTPARDAQKSMESLRNKLK